MNLDDPLFVLTLAASAGTLLVVLADRLRIPSIALLLPGGLLLGPSALGLLDPHALHRGLETVVKAAVAIILFEGGLTLDVEGYRRAPVVIGRMLTLGVLVTWLGVALALYAYTDISGDLALLGGALVSVTGPTVVSPILRRIRLRQRLHHVLYWEGVLVDFVGAFLAVLVFEWVAPGVRHDGPGPLGGFVLRLVLGATAGYAWGWAMVLILGRARLRQDHVNIFVLAMALLLFGLCDAVLSESGILAVIVAGLVVGFHRPPELANVKRFKLQLTELAIGVIFVLLSAHLDLSRLPQMGAGAIALLAVVLVGVRPASIWLCTIGRGFDVREKLFMSWLAPRGIVAASMASLFTLELTAAGRTDAWILETFTYALIATTVLVQGLTAGLLAPALGVVEPPRRTWLLVGQARLVGALARALRATGARSTVLVEDPGELPATDDGAPAILVGDPLDPDLTSDPQLADVGAVLAVTPNRHLNQLVCQLWRERLGDDRCFRWGELTDAARAGTHDVHRRAGRVVWADLPAPDTVAHDLREADLAIDAVTTPAVDEDGRLGPHLLPLFRVADGNASIVVAPSSPDAHRVDGAALVALRHRLPGLSTMRWDAVAFDEPPASFDAVIDRLLRRAAENCAVALPVERLRDGILEREQTMSTAVGHGVSIPHAYVDGLDATRCTVGVIPSGLPIETADGAPIRLVFLLLSPKDRAEVHLQSLAAIAHLVADDPFVDRLVRQRDPTQVLRLIAERT